jgi:hypothetical protein
MSLDASPRALIGHRDRARPGPLMAAIDACNARFGRAAWFRRTPASSRSASGAPSSRCGRRATPPRSASCRSLWPADGAPVRSPRAPIGGRVPPCARRGAYDLDRLRKRFGEHADLYDVYLRLTQTCRHQRSVGTEQPNQYGRTCRAAIGVEGGDRRTGFRTGPSSSSPTYRMWSPRGLRRVSERERLGQSGNTPSSTRLAEAEAGDPWNAGYELSWPVPGTGGP